MSHVEAVTRSEVDPDTGQRVGQGLRIVAAGFIIQLVLWGGYYSFGAFLVPMSEDLGESRAQIAAVYTLVTLVFGVGSVLSGSLTDRWGPRKVITTCTVLAAIGYALMSFVTQAWHAHFALGLLTGIGLTGSYVPVTSTVARWFEGRRGTMMGVVIAGNAVGAMTGPALMGMLLDAVGWRHAYLLLAGVLALACLPAARFMRSPTAVEQANDSTVPTIVGEAASLASSRRRLRGSATFWTLCVVWAIHGAVGTGLMVHYYAHMESRGAELRTISLVLAVLGATGIIGGLAGGLVGDRVSPARALAAGYLFCATAVVLLLMASGTGVFLAVSLLFGLGWFGIGVLVPLVAATSVEHAQLGKALGWLELLWAVGAGIGPTVMGWFYDRNGDYSVGLWLLLALALLAAPLSLLLRRQPA